MTTASQQQTCIDAVRLLSRIGELRALGGTADGGVSRLAFGREDVKGRDLVAGYLTQAGLDVLVDPAANLLGRLPGRHPELGALVLGSHLDTVPGGGAYDGAYGVLAAVEVAATLRDHGIVLDRPLVVAAFSNEEGTTGTPAMFGSRAVAGHLEPGELGLTVEDGDRTLAQVLDEAGGDSERIALARWEPGSIAAYLELHIEQGPVLQQSGTAIGVVEGISGRLSAEVTVHGEANHAGTTPMSARKDALGAAARLILGITGMAGEHGTVRVATVGDCEVRPGAWNVVPGEARFLVDLRDMSDRALTAALTRLREQATEIAAVTGTRIEVTPSQRVPPTPCDPGRQLTVEHTARGLGLSCLTLPSGAGHDAQWMARIAPMGMIFVPSQAGASHVPHERTTPEDLVNGANVLLGCTLEEGKQW